MLFLICVYSLQEGYTALHYASSQGHRDILIALLLYEPINVSLRNMVSIHYIYIYIYTYYIMLYTSYAIYYYLLINTVYTVHILCRMYYVQFKLTAAQIAKNEEIRALFYEDLTPSMHINDNNKDDDVDIDIKDTLDTI